MRISDNILDMKQRAAVLKRATNVTLSEPLLAEAKTLGINISQAAEAGVAGAVAEKRAERWAHENHAAIQSSNAYVEQHGLPLAKYRTF